VVLGLVVELEYLLAVADHHLEVEVVLVGLVVTVSQALVAMEELVFLPR
jgi:hypothetical protein